MLYDQNQDPIEDQLPCKGSPLDIMTITTYNQGVQSNRFGYVRTGNNCENNTKGRHEGIDLQAAINTPVHSVSSGYLSLKGYNTDGWGHYVVIRSGNLHYLYGHLAEDSPLEWNIPITVNQVIGHSGESETVGKPHLHFEVRENTGGPRTSYNDMVKKDPEDYLSSHFDGAGDYTGDDC